MTHKLTFIDNDGDIHEPKDFNVTDENHKTGFRDAIRVTILDRDVPQSLNGKSPSAILDWEVVITYGDNEPRGGRVSSGERQYNKTLLTIILD